jgi:hypothetical protein
MDVVANSIITALIAGAATGAKEVSGSLLVDSYKSIKGLLHRRFAKNPTVLGAVASLEEKPASPGRQATLKEELGAAQVDGDSDILAAAELLLSHLPIPQARSKTTVSANAERAVAIGGSANGATIVTGDDSKLK